jgi:hypothetical protein
MSCFNSTSLRDLKKKAMGYSCPSYFFLRQYCNNGFLRSERENKELFGIVRDDQYMG